VQCNHYSAVTFVTVVCMHGDGDGRDTLHAGSGRRRSRLWGPGLTLIFCIGYLATCFFFVFSPYIPSLLDTYVHMEWKGKER
jgi:hypothetical protein